MDLRMPPPFASRNLYAGLCALSLAVACDAVPDPTDATRSALNADQTASSSIPKRGLLLTTHGGLHAVVEEDVTVVNPAELRLADSEHHVVTAKVDQGRLSEAQRALLGSTLEVLTDRGERCRARVTGLVYRVELIPDGTTLDAWQGLDGLGEGRNAPLSGSDLAQAIWDMSAQKSLAARLTLLAGATCEGTPLLATRPEQRVQLAAPATTSEDDRARALAAFRALPEYAAHQRAFEAEAAGDGRTRPFGLWEDDDHVPTVQTFWLATSGQTLVSVAAPFATCRGSDLGLWAVFRLDEAGRLQPLHRSSDTVPNALFAVVDTETSGLQFLADEGLGGTSLLRDGQRLASWAAEFHGCPC